LSFAEEPVLDDDPALSPETLLLGSPETPSWVARWDEETWFPTSAMCGLKPHREHVESPAAVSVADANSGVLSLEGHILDTVVYVAPDVDPTRLPSAWAQALTGVITANRDLAHESADQHCADLIAFMLDALDANLNNLKASQETNKFLRLLLVMKPSFPNGDGARFQMAMVLLLTYRRISVTAQGYLVLGHSKTQGDVVVCLSGGRLPSVFCRLSTDPVVILEHSNILTLPLAYHEDSLD
jgi:hypothetical protein